MTRDEVIAAATMLGVPLQQWGSDVALCIRGKDGECACPDRFGSNDFSSVDVYHQAFFDMMVKWAEGRK